MQKCTLTQNKLEKASVLQHYCPEFDPGEKRQRAVWVASYTKASTKHTSKQLTPFLLIQNSLYNFYWCALLLESVWEQANTRSGFEETPARLHMEIFGGLYMRSRLSPLFSPKTEVEKAKIRRFSCFRLIFSFFILALLAKNGVVFTRFRFDFVQVNSLVFAQKKALKLADFWKKINRKAVG